MRLPRVFNLLVLSVLGKDCLQQVSPHTFHHTFASIHLSRDPDLLWVQRMGGWTSTKVLLDTYGHFTPSQQPAAYAGAVAARNGNRRNRLMRSQRTTMRTGRKSYYTG